MSPSKNAVELYALLIDEAYGELTSRIYTILLRRGRLPIKLLSKHTLLTERQLQHGLAVLIQQGLIYHHTERDTKITFYEANGDAAYGLARAGKIMEIVESRFGAPAREVVHTLFLLGHTSVSDLAKAYEQKRNGHVNANDEVENEHSNGTNGTNEPGILPIISEGHLHSVLNQLLDVGFLEPVVRSMFCSPADTYDQIEKEILWESFGGNTKGATQKEILKMKVKSRLQDMRSERAWKGVVKKRILNGQQLNGANKRRRLSNGGSTFGDQPFEDDGIRLDSALIVHINYEKFTVILRNEALVTFAKERIGETTSLIYGEGLRLLEAKIPRCQLNPKIDDVVDLPDGPIFMTKELMAILSDSINPGTGIGKGPDQTSPRQHHSEVRKGKPQETELDGDISMGDDDDQSKFNGHSKLPDDDDPFADSPKRNPAKRPRVTFQERMPIPESFEDQENRAELVKKHLLLLDRDDVHFLRKCGTNGLGEWTCDFERLVSRMQESAVDDMLLENFGPSGHRLARMLRKLGKLDEKTLADAGKLRPKDVRTKLAEMQMASVIDIQEVPRDNGRTANRTIYLWSFNEERAASKVLEHTYKAMSRILQRLDTERRRAHDVLALTQRSDVRDLDPEVYLDTHQLNEFRAIDAKIDNLMCQITRLDLLVGLFKEF